jgi:hypothetical protein
MTPTNELRWVTRTVPAPEFGEDVGKRIQVLQQKWTQYWSDDMGGGERAWEWRDIETVKEQS